MQCNNSHCQEEVHEITNIINGITTDNYGADTETFVLCRECHWKIIHYLQGCGDYFFTKETNHDQ